VSVAAIKFRHDVRSPLLSARMRVQQRSGRENELFGRWDDERALPVGVPADRF